MYRSRLSLFLAAGLLSMPVTTLTQSTIPTPPMPAAAGVTPFLMFEGQAQQAMELYTQVIPDSEILDVERHGPAGPGPEGTIVLASMSLRGQTVLVSDSYISHGFTFTPSFSLLVTCEDEAELERLRAEQPPHDRIALPLDRRRHRVCAGARVE